MPHCHKNQELPPWCDRVLMHSHGRVRYGVGERQRIQYLLHLAEETIDVVSRVILIQGLLMLLHFFQNEIFNICHPFGKWSVLSREMLYEFWPQIVHLKMGGGGNTLEIQFVKRKQSSWMDCLTLSVVWPDGIPSSNFQAEEKGGQSLHTGERPLPISLLIPALANPWVIQEKMGTRPLKETQATEDVLSVPFCVGKAIEASRGQTSNGAGITAIALIHLTYVEGRWQWMLTSTLVPGIGELIAWTNEVNHKYRCSLSLTWIHGELNFLEFSFNKLIR